MAGASACNGLHSGRLIAGLFPAEWLLLREASLPTIAPLAETLSDLSPCLEPKVTHMCLLTLLSAPQRQEWLSWLGHSCAPVPRMETAMYQEFNKLLQKEDAHGTVPSREGSKHTGGFRK